MPSIELMAIGVLWVTYVVFWGIGIAGIVRRWWR